MNPLIEAPESRVRELLHVKCDDRQPVQWRAESAVCMAAPYRQMALWSRV
ncbi:MAG: hypothetical protein NVSMB22_28730 [Chloroflexota bacterium]